MRRNHTRTLIVHQIWISEESKVYPFCYFFGPSIGQVILMTYRYPYPSPQLFVRLVDLQVTNLYLEHSFHSQFIDNSQESRLFQSIQIS